MPKQVKAAVIATAYPPTTEAHHRSQTIEPLPQSIELSPAQREILDLIVQDQTSIQGPVQPERAILLWSDGISESATARELDISKEAVRSLRHRWLASTARIAAAEKKLLSLAN
jgi:DNA-binding CsgD family transcriptional regulator